MNNKNMPIQKIKILINNLPTSQTELINKVNNSDHFEIARLLHQLSTGGKK